MGLVLFISHSYKRAIMIEATVYFAILAQN